MRHRKAGRRLGRNSAHRKAMYRNMVTSLMVHGQIQTTEAKACLAKPSRPHKLDAFTSSDVRVGG